MDYFVTAPCRVVVAELDRGASAEQIFDDLLRRCLVDPLGVSDHRGRVDLAVPARRSARRAPCTCAAA